MKQVSGPYNAIVERVLVSLSPRSLDKELAAQCLELAVEMLCN